MSKIFLAGFALLFFGSACAGLQSSELGGSAGKGKPPVISQSFASKQLAAGDTWKIFLNASDVNGDMKQIVSTVSQPGVGESVSYTRIKKEDEKEFSGYIYLTTFNSPNYSALNFTTLTLTVQIKDAAGNISKPQVFPLSFNSTFTQEPPPPGVFKEKDMGGILVTLRTPSGRR